MPRKFALNFSGSAQPPRASNARWRPLFDHFVRAKQDVGRQIEAKSRRRPCIDDQLKGGGLANISVLFERAADYLDKLT
ncbi:MAG: hypothetical protein WA683_08755, partial [Pseudolabrys sp.]